ncbi:MAG: UDP binding domain-containing protein, partial [Novosphingobium sp.]
EGEPLRLATRIVEELAARGVEAGQAKLLLLGIAYKKDVEDTRESPALELLGALEGHGVAVDYHDPFFPELPMTRDHGVFAGRRSVALGPAVADYDAVIIATDHTGVDYAGVASHARLIIDTRNALAKAGAHIAADKLLKL